ncbi:MAG: SDR family oxidoreductase [Chloroflexi bacterium]|nr:SDR family oxidoreductase [Chloroflexota bacterium]
MTTNNTALITGASSGIGAAFARQLAAQGHNLILVARRRERLAELSTELEEQHAISAQVLVADLATRDGIEQVEGQIAELDTLDILVNNAGFGIVGKFAEGDLGRHLDMIHVHVVASVRLCRAVLPGMIARDRGGIINVSSISAFTPVGNVTYTSTKAYLVAFSEALQAELAGVNVRVQALCPGFTYTGFHDTPELIDDFDRARIPRMLWMSADRVVTGSLKALERGNVIFIPGIRNRLLTAVSRSRIISLIYQTVRKGRGHTNGQD